MKRNDQVQIVNFAVREIDECHDILDVAGVPREVDGEQQSLSQRTASLVCNLTELWKKGRALEAEVRKVEITYGDLERRLQHRAKALPNPYPRIERSAPGRRDDPDTDLRDEDDGLDFRGFY